MRFLHLGDLHLGKSVNEYSMIEDQRYILRQILEMADAKNVDAVLIAGDIYDKSVPSEEAVRLLNDFIMKLAERKLPAYIITGNHDSDERLNFGSSLFEANGIHIGAKYDGQIPCYEMEDEYGPVQIHLLPFVKASTVRHYYPDEKIENYDDAIRVALKHVADVTMRINPESDAAACEKNVPKVQDSSKTLAQAEIRKVLLAHQFVIGSTKQYESKDLDTNKSECADTAADESECADMSADKLKCADTAADKLKCAYLSMDKPECADTAADKPESTDPVTAGSENVSTLNVGTVEKVDVSCFDGYDYVALGHIHSPQKVGRETVRYSGSPLKYSLSEIHNNKSVPIITLKEKGNVEIECLPLVPKREMRHIKGKMNQLLDPANIVDPDDYIYVTLTDEITIMDAMARVQHFYPNTMRLDYDNAHTKSIETVDFSDITEGQSFEELMEAFYASVYQKDISDEELSILQDVAREAGVLLSERDMSFDAKNPQEKDSDSKNLREKDSDSKNLREKDSDSKNLWENDSDLKYV